MNAGHVTGSWFRLCTLIGSYWCVSHVLRSFTYLFMQLATPSHFPFSEKIKTSSFNLSHCVHRSGFDGHVALFPPSSFLAFLSFALLWTNSTTSLIEKSIILTGKEHEKYTNLLFRPEMCHKRWEGIIKMMLLCFVFECNLFFWFEIKRTVKENCSRKKRQILFWWIKIGSGEFWWKQLKDWGNCKNLWIFKN